MSRSSRGLTILALGTLLALPAFAGGPLVNCRPGEPHRWPDGGRAIPFDLDLGPLAGLSNDDATDLFLTAQQRWTDLPSATTTFAAPGRMPVDITVDNFAQFLNTAAPDGLNPIAFDDTGEIFVELFGENSGMFGFAGAEWLDPLRCEIEEAALFLNGPALTDATVALDIMVHELGHFQNLAHSNVNGQLVFGDTSGPFPDDTFPVPPLGGTIETMYPLYFGPVAGTSTPHRDDIAALSTLYPAPDFSATTGTIGGTILGPNGTTPLTGVNVIARNLADPFLDAVSAISSATTDDFAPADPFVGSYTLAGLTAGADYAVFTDGLIAGTFSTPPFNPLPGPEEFYNGSDESTDGDLDAPLDRVALTPLAGQPISGIDIAFNAGPEGPVTLSNDQALQIFLPFTVPFCGRRYDSLWINANGSLTFEAGDTDRSPTPRELLSGPPRIAPLWSDLDPSAGGEIAFEVDPYGLAVRFSQVPRSDAEEDGGGNSFEVFVDRFFGFVRIDYGDLDVTGGIAGLSCGGDQTSGFERETDLRRHGGLNLNHLRQEAADFESFEAGDNDLAGSRLKFLPRFLRPRDAFEPNDRFDRAVWIAPPFSTDQHLSEISPAGDDVDFFRFRARAGETVAIEVVRSNVDTLIGVFDGISGELLMSDEDGGNGDLSRLLFSLDSDRELVLAVTCADDIDFSGDGREGGRYTLLVNSYRGELVAAGDDTSAEVELATFEFPFAGRLWDRVFVNSNGNLTFGEGSSRRSEAVDQLLAGPPRIAVLWDDLDASRGMVLAERNNRSLAIHFLSVPEFGSRNPNYFTVRLKRSGRIDMTWDATARRDALVGVSPGEGASDPGATDLSRRFVHRGETVYEVFPLSGGEDFDLFYRTRRFKP
ncbi:MAG: hypothetical protein AAF604_15975 [Acidobacteriota bacterium]